jgi:hypothetical protein
MSMRLGSTPIRRVLLICATALAMSTAGLTAYASTGSVVARQARKIYLVENARLHVVHNNEYESTIGERGQATGTFNAPVTAALTLVPSHVTAVFTIYPHGDSISGIARANYIVKNSIGYFGGTLTITRGTGAYRRASGTNVGFSGSIDRQSFSMSIKVHGWAVL